MPSTGRHPVKTTPALAAGAVINANGNGTGQDMRGCGEIVAILDVLALTGSASPTLNAKLQVAPSLSGTYVDIPGGAFAAVTAAGRATLKVIGDAGNGFVRAAYTVSGTTPTFTTALNLIGLSLHDSVLAEAI